MTIAFEPVTHEEVGFNNTIEAVASLVRRLNLPGLRMMIDTFHMNIEEKDMLAPLPAIRDILAHVHLCETNRDFLGRATGTRRGCCGSFGRSATRDSAPWACTICACRGASAWPGRSTPFERRASAKRDEEAR